MTVSQGAIDWRGPVVVVAAGCAIATIGFGLRSTFGLYLEPMTVARGWDRETFALAMAIQNLLWGISVPIAGALLDRYGPFRVLGVGAVLYASGIAGMASAMSGTMLTLTGGVLVGLGVGFTFFSLALAAMTKAVGPDKRSMVLGLGTAAGSFGQVVFSPIGQGLIEAMGWHAALLVYAATIFLVVPLAMALPKHERGAASYASDDQSAMAALREAVAHRGFVLLTTGFFVCGFHVAFVTVHFPAYVRDLGLAAHVGAWAIATIGLFNVAGSFASGLAGQRWSKKNGLSLIYTARAVAIVGLLIAPKSEMTIFIFAAAMGVFWLSTVPLTTGIVMQVFGLRYLATLYGVVFFGHQLGSFSGVWLGGYLHDATGSYDAMWWIGAGLSVLAALIHLPIDERPLARLAEPAA